MTSPLNAKILFTVSNESESLGPVHDPNFSRLNSWSTVNFDGRAIDTSRTEVSPLIPTYPPEILRPHYANFTKPSAKDKFIASMKFICPMCFCLLIGAVVIFLVTRS